MKQHSVSIWFIIGLLLTIYGILITGSGIYQLSVPPGHPVVLADLHPGIWWGAVILVIGIVYIVRFRPSAREY